MKHLQTLESLKLWVIVPAAGSGSRFSQTELKQYQIIEEKTVLEHTIQRLNDLPLTGYVLAIGAQDDIAQKLPFRAFEKAHFCQGGAERVNSVLNALNYLSQIAHAEDWVLVHDAARPCVAVENLLALLEYAITYKTSAILAIPVRDTLKYVDQTQKVKTTVSREQLWQAQTPQIAQLGMLKHAIEQALQDQVMITDEASALEYIGATVHVVTGRSDNIKITYPEDLELARLILQSQQKSV